MKSATLLAVALATLTSAHGSGEVSGPKLMGGRRFLSDLKARHALPASMAKSAVHVEERTPNVLDTRADPETCGPGIGSCVNACCSAAGYCGTTEEYCAAPDCQFRYGPLCDANIMPSGASTASIARPHIGSVPYGGLGIYNCINAGDVAFTFDDGPYSYTDDLLTKLAAYDAKATFMITGNNLGKGPIDTTPQWSTVIKRMVSEGHQIASHTWSHQNLTDLDPTTFNEQMIYNEMAFNNILGYFPTYMRPPYSECNATCGDILATLGYHVIYFDVDTAGYLNDDPTLIQTSKNIWDAAVAGSNPATDSFLEIEHDIHYQTVYNLTDYILASMYNLGYKSVTVGECLGDPSANWYRSGDASAPVPPASQQISEDGTRNADITCFGSEFGNCCSAAGWCGSTDEYCGTGCQSASGNCTTTSTTTSVPVTPTSTSTSTTPSGTGVISTDGSCSSTITCVGSEYGNCCSQYGYCGSTTDYCGTGCNPLGGSCTSSGTPTTTTSAPASTSTSTLTVSDDATCGGTTKKTCQGSTFGNCCSQYGYCGSTTDYCSASNGCQSGFGTCS